MEEIEKYLKAIRENIDKINQIDPGLGSIFNTGFNYSIELLDSKLSNKEMSAYNYIDFILKTTGINLETLFSKYIEEHNLGIVHPDSSKVDSEIVNFITNNNVSSDASMNDLDGLDVEEYKKFINENLNELKKEI